MPRINILIDVIKVIRAYHGHSMLKCQKREEKQEELQKKNKCTNGDKCGWHNMILIFMIALQYISCIHYFKNVDKKNSIHGIFQIAHLRIGIFPLFYFKPQYVEENKMYNSKKWKYIIVKFEKVKFIGIQAIKV